MRPKVKVLVCDAMDSEGIEKLKQAGFEVDVKSSLARDQLREVVSDYDALIVRSRTKVTKEIIEAGGKLRAIGRVGAGLDNIDVEAASRKGIAVLNTPEAPADAVAELAMALILSLARRIPFADRSMKEGKWVKSELMGWQLRGKTLGLIGSGNIGEKVARIAKAFGMNILITKRTPLTLKLQAELGAEYLPPEDFSDFLQKCDVITIHVPLTARTRHMIGETEIRLIKDGAFLINTSRGEIVDGNALLEALQSGKLAGAALDVHEVEPPRDLALIRLSNVVCTPHIGGQTLESQKAAAMTIAEKLVKLLSNPCSSTS